MLKEEEEEKKETKIKETEKKQRKEMTWPAIGAAPLSIIAD